MAVLSRDTIFALSSPPGRGGVAVVRVSGPLVRTLFCTVCGTLPAPRTTVLRTIRHPSSGEALDRGLVFWHAGPDSFTGEDVLELHVHGSPAVTAALLSALGSVEGCRVAEPGEFTRRAFVNGKLGLLEAEGLADLVNASTRRQREQAYAQVSGVASTIVLTWQRELRDALARTEAVIDFADDVGGIAALEQAVVERLAVLRQEIARHVERAAAARKIRHGYRVLICGAPNVGKSSLLNHFAGSDRAIVSERAGTTRDLIEVPLDLGGLEVTMIDSAGLRSVEGDDLESEGIRRTLREQDRADVILWVDAPGILVEEAALPVRLDSRTIRVWNKADLAPPPDGFDSIPISCAESRGFERLLEVLAERLGSHTTSEPSIATRTRHRLKLEAVVRLLDLIRPELQFELVAERLRESLRQLDELVGRTETEDILDRVFAEFCIGK